MTNRPIGSANSTIKVSGDNVGSDSDKKPTPDEILRRMLNTPPEPHKEKGSVKDSVTESDKGDDCRPTNRGSDD